MPSPADFQLLAKYNQWMNNKVYDATATLTPDDFTEHRGAFFGSVSGTLNHILVADIIWLKRYARHPMDFPALAPVLALPDPASLNAVLHDEFDALWQARQALDKVILEFADALSEEAIATPLAYHNTKGEPYTKQLGHLLMHLFNHQTHHRGQVTTLLNQYGADVGVTDLLALLPDTEEA